MKVLVVGSGGREHAVIRKLAENPEIDRFLRAGQRRHQRTSPVGGNKGYRRGGDGRICERRGD